MIVRARRLHFAPRIARQMVISSEAVPDSTVNAPAGEGTERNVPASIELGRRLNKAEPRVLEDILGFDSHGYGAESLQGSARERCGNRKVVDYDLVGGHAAFNSRTSKKPSNSGNSAMILRGCALSKTSSRVWML
jgi:hypothetical protein